MATRKNEIIDSSINKRVYTPNEIMVIMGMPRATAYQFLNKVYEDQAPFKVIKINTIIRVPKEGFDAWLNSVR